MAWLPSGFVPPLLETASFRLRSITIDDVVKDFDAVMATREHLWELFGEGWGWPGPDLTIRANLAELGWHEVEFQHRSSFDYAVMAPDESALLGCVYVDPPTKGVCDAEVAYWARTPELEEELGREVRAWVEREWPFERPAYPGRDVAWRDWFAADG